jgi:hypothetical protein
MTRFSELLEEEYLRQESAARNATSFAESLRALSDHVIHGALESATPGAEDAFVLGVGTPRDLYELKRAFRRMALETHPDRPGGSHAAFLRTQALFEEALLGLAQLPSSCAPPPVRAGVLRRATEGLAATYA